jgi:dTDP-4-amino-4,6-dideoxygalactose transaminase
MLNTPFTEWPFYSEEEGNIVKEVLLQNDVNYRTGKRGYKFEKEFAEWTGSKYAVSVANGTVALDLTMVALGIGPGDEVIVSPRTFFASASTIVTAGATPIFAEVDRDSQNITAESIKKVMTSKTKAVICVHHAGWPCEMDPIMKLAQDKHIKIVEDCAQAHGARYKGCSVGSIGHLGAWSFCQDKIMTIGGEGGMVTTNDEELWKKMWSYRDHGKTFDPDFQIKSPKKNNANKHWSHRSFGTNWRLTEMQSALGRYQIKRMPEWSRKRRANSKKIKETCREFLSIRVPEVPDYIDHACYKHFVFVRPAKLKAGWNRDRIMEEINELEVPCYSGGCPEVYREPAFKGTSFELRDYEHFPIAKKLGETSLMFLVHPTLKELEIKKTCEVIQQVMKEASLDEFPEIKNATYPLS